MNKPYLYKYVAIYELGYNVKRAIPGVPQAEGLWAGDTATFLTDMSSESSRCPTPPQRPAASSVRPGAQKPGCGFPVANILAHDFTPGPGCY